MVQSVHCVALSQPQKGHFGRHEPAGEVSEQKVVTERNEILQLPEQGAGVSVVVVTQREVLSLGSSLEECLMTVSIKMELFLSIHYLDVFVEPRLVPQSDLVEFVWVTAVDHVARHHDGPVLAVHQTLHQLGAVRPFQLPLHGLHHLL